MAVGVSAIRVANQVIKVEVMAQGLGVFRAIAISIAIKNRSSYPGKQYTFNCGWSRQEIFRPPAGVVFWSPPPV